MTRMTKGTVIAILFSIVAAPASEAAVWNLEKFFPGERARTHDLVDTNGEKLTYSFYGGGSFGREVDPRGVDYQFWTDTGMIYVGWDWHEPGNPVLAFRTIPFNLNMPRMWDDTTVWTTTYSDALTRQQYDEAAKEWDFVSQSKEKVLVEIRQEWLNGEWTIFMKGGVSGVYEERWWFSQCISVAGEATCSPGVRQIQMLDADGKVRFERRFEAWVLK